MHFLDFLWHGMEFQNGFSFGTNLMLVKVSRDTKNMSCIVIALRSYDSVPQICILRNGFLSGERNSRMDFPFAGCWSNQINIYSPKGGSVKPFFDTFLLCFNFLNLLTFLDFLFTRNGIPEWIFLWHKSEACQGLNGHQRWAA